MGAAGSSCVRECVRSTRECATEDVIHTTVDVPVGLASSSSCVPRPGASDDVEKVGAHPSKGDAAAGGVVPPVPNWFRVLQADRQSRTQRTETPRFDEVSQPLPMSNRSGGDLVTPRGVAGGEFCTPRPSPRESQTELWARPEELSYEGTYLGTMKHGHGKLQMRGSAYEGEFVDDCKHGFGILSWDDGRRYRGEFQCGKFHGTAVMTWADGRRFAGQYVEDRKHGDGTFSWQDGRCYRGQWSRGKRHGIGVYTNAKGLTRQGFWESDRPMRWEPLPESPTRMPPAWAALARSPAKVPALALEDLPAGTSTSTAPLAAAGASPADAHAPAALTSNLRRDEV